MFEGTSVRKCSNKFGILLTYSYLCKNYGIKLYLGRFFPACLCDSNGEAGVLGRLGCVPRNDGLDILVIEDGIRDLVGTDWGTVTLVGCDESR